jgi:hypothetical protein
MVNVFENNEPNNDEGDIEELDDQPLVTLPPPGKGNDYKFKLLPSGRIAVVLDGEMVTPGDEERTCGCAPYQGCHKCGKYRGDGLNSPDSRTLRHQDWPPQN